MTLLLLGGDHTGITGVDVGKANKIITRHKVKRQNIGRKITNKID